MARPLLLMVLVSFGFACWDVPLVCSSAALAILARLRPYVWECFCVFSCLGGFGGVAGVAGELGSMERLRKVKAGRGQYLSHH